MAAAEHDRAVASIPVSDAPAVDPALVDTAVEIARAAGELTLRWFRDTGLTIERT